MKSPGRWTIWLVCIVAVATLMGLASFWGQPRNGDVLSIAEELSENAVQEYASGSFGAATNAILNEVQYLQTHRDALLRLLRVDTMLRTSYARLMTLFLHAGDIDRAEYYLAKCYSLFIRDTAAHPVKEMSREEFVDFTTNWIETIDRRTGAKWKADLPLDEAIIETLRTRFAETDGADPHLSSGQ